MNLNRLELIKDEKLLHRISISTSPMKGHKIGETLKNFIVKNQISSCAGLSACQVGIFERVFVMWVGDHYETFVDPKLVSTGHLVEKQNEQCLSLPGRTYLVERPTSIIVKDKLRDKPLELAGLTARIWLHEADHLNGRLISDIGTKVE